MRKIISKNKIIRAIVVATLSLGISLCSLLVGSFNSMSLVETMVYSSRTERKAHNTDFVYAEAISSVSNNLFNDPASTYGVTFDNYWHFDNRPNIFAFRKWDSSIDPNSNEEVYPLSFKYEIDGKNKQVETPIISIIGNRWEGDISHLGLKVIDEDFTFDITDNIAIQNSVILSYSLASKMAPENPNSLVGAKIKEDVVFLNSYYKEAHYNNSSKSEAINEVNIVAVFDEKSSSKMGKFVQDDFVFMFGGKEGTYNHCGLRIGCHFSSDDYANYVALSQFLTLDNEKSSIVFYDYIDGGLSIGGLQSRYLNTKNMSNSTWSKLGPILSFTFLIGFLVLFWGFVYRKRTLFDTFVCGISFVVLAFFFSLIKMISFGNLCVVLLNPIGCSILLILALAIVIAMIRPKEYRVAKKAVTSKAIEKHDELFNIMSYLSLILCVISTYIIFHSLTLGNKYFLLPSLVMGVGMFLCLIMRWPKFSVLNRRIDNVFLRKAVSFAISFSICSAASILIILISSLIIPNLVFNIKNIIFSLLVSIFAFIIAIIFNNIKNRGRPSQNHIEYMEINI